MHISCFINTFKVKKIDKRDVSIHPPPPPHTIFKVLHLRLFGQYTLIIVGCSPNYFLNNSHLLKKILV